MNLIFWPSLDKFHSLCIYCINFGSELNWAWSSWSETEIWMSGKFRVSVWDPTLIVAQIVTVQAFIYVSFGGLLLLGSFFTGTQLTLNNIFFYKALTFDRIGILTISCYTLNALLGSLALWVVVKRTKLCLDFTATTYLIHLIFCLFYNGSLPNTLSWWLFTLASIGIMCVSGEFLCLRTEMQDIPLLGARVDLWPIGCKL